jgi:RNA polymerase sigma factor (TIGR02999 family)
MNSAGPADITGLLAAWNKGDESALNELIPLVYEDIRGIARRHLRRESPGNIVQSGTLAHEAYVKLVQGRGIQCDNRAHFFALCSQMIRRLLVDHARKQGSAKRGGSLQVPLDEALLGSKARGVEMEALDEALTSLHKVDARKARVVELRFFGGLSIVETAEVLEISEETVARDWRVAKTWLVRELKPDEHEPKRRRNT